MTTGVQISDWIIQGFTGLSLTYREALGCGELIMVMAYWLRLSGDC